MPAFAFLHTIRARLVMLVVAAVSVSTIAVGALSLWQTASHYATQKRDTMFSAAQVLAAAAARGVAEKDVRAVYESVRAIGRIDGMTYVAVLDMSGRMIADLGATEQLDGDLSIDETSRDIAVSSLLQSRSIELKVPIVRGGETIGRLVLMSDISDLGAGLRRALATTLAGALVALALGLAVALRMQGAITRPLTGLTSVMARVGGDHDYTVNAPVEGAGEISVLARGFNAMLADIRERDQKLGAYREHLEQEVAQRTADLVAARDAAQSANVQKSEFLATMSHEIRTPMNGMLVMAELLASSDLPVRARRHADVIARSGQSLLAIINDILDFSKVESGKLELEKTPTDLCEIVETVVSLFAERAHSKGLDLASFVDIDVPARIDADPVRLNQVLGNLVNNALKFTESGGVTVCVTRDPADAARVLVQVRDTGIGIPAEKLDTIFEAFTQADQSTTRRFGGTGLGLAISNKLVQAMGAQINVESRVDAGSTFSFSLACEGGETAVPAWPKLADTARVQLCVAPLTAVSVWRYVAAAGASVLCVEKSGVPAALAQPGLVIADAKTLTSAGVAHVERKATVVALAPAGDAAGDLTLTLGVADMVLPLPLMRTELRDLLTRTAAGEALDAGTPKVSAKAAAAALTYRGARVLVADDSAVNREVAVEALSAFGIKPDLVADGAQALAAWRRNAYDLVLLDGSMPELDGFETARRIRADETSRGGEPTPLIALTAHVIGAGSQAWREAGMDGVLHKPFTIAQLGAVLEKYLAGKQGEAVEATESICELPAENQPVIDPHVLEQFSSLAATGFAARVTRLYAEHAPQAVAQIAQSFAMEELEELGKAAHALKSMSLNIGARRVAAAANDIERIARQDGRLPEDALIASLPELVGEACRAFEPFRAAA